jgi:hypothetical protein
MANYLLEGGAHFYKPKFKDKIKGGKVVWVEFFDMCIYMHDPMT